jgi:hypothetical protein
MGTQDVVMRRYGDGVGSGQPDVGPKGVCTDE